MKNNEEQYINMEHVIGYLAIEYEVPIISLDSLILLGQRTVNVYNLQKYSKKIPFGELCEYITMFIQTPFGNKMLRELI